jgi:hypothetical protein
VVEISNENGWFIRSPRSLRVFVQKRIATSDARYKRRLVIKFSTCIQVNIKGGMEAIRQYKKHLPITGKTGAIFISFEIIFNCRNTI